MPPEKRNPYMKWYARDWRGDGSLRMCSFAARGLWADLLSIMHDEGEPYGHLSINGSTPTLAQIARMVGSTSKEVGKLLSELELAAIFSRTQNGVIYSRRMVRDKAKEAEDRQNGKGGGNPNLKPPDNRGVNPQDKAHSQKPEPEPKPVAAAVEVSTEETANQLHRLSRLLGFSETDHMAYAANVRTLVELRQQGCDFQAHILPAAEAAALTGRAKTLAYIRPKALEMRDASKTVASMPAPFVQTDERGWRDRIHIWRESGRWHPTKWGPRPDEPGCKCPAEILNAKEAA